MCCVHHGMGDGGLNSYWLICIRKTSMPYTRRRARTCPHIYYNQFLASVFRHISHLLLIFLSSLFYIPSYLLPNTSCWLPALSLLHKHMHTDERTVVIHVNPSWCLFATVAIITITIIMIVWHKNKNRTHLTAAAAEAEPGVGAGDVPNIRNIFGK